MSTVVLSPTHIACDHTVVYQSYPHFTKVDLHHRKLFVAPSKKFIVGVVGSFSPEAVDDPEIYDLLALMLGDFISQEIDYGLFKQLATLDPEIKKKVEKPLKLLRAFDFASMYVFLVAKKYRFLVRRTKDMKSFYAIRLDDFSGIGTGGMKAVGLLRGGMKIHDIWEPLHRIDPMTSVEHTVIPLSSLTPLRIKK